MKKLILLVFFSLPLTAHAQKQVKIENPYVIMGTDNDMLNMMMKSEAAPDSLKTLWEGLELEESLIISYDEDKFDIKTPIDPEIKTHQVRKVGETYVIIKTADGDYGYFHLANKQLYVMSTAEGSNFIVGFGKGINEMRETLDFIKTRLSAYGMEQREIIAELIKRFDKYDY